jgi:hypothetical protein
MWRRRGKTPVPAADEARALLHAIPTGSLIGLRDRAVTKVVRVALQDAASVAGLLITTEAMVADRPEPKGQPGMPPGGMGGMDY